MVARYELITDGVFVTIGVEGIGLRPGVTGKDGMSGTAIDSDGASADETKVGVGDLDDSLG